MTHLNFSKYQHICSLFPTISALCSVFYFYNIFLKFLLRRLVYVVITLISLQEERKMASLSSGSKDNLSYIWLHSAWSTSSVFLILPFLILSFTFSFSHSLFCTFYFYFFLISLFPLIVKASFSLPFHSSLFLILHFLFLSFFLYPILKILLQFCFLIFFLTILTPSEPLLHFPFIFFISLFIKWTEIKKKKRKN